ncbi:hypothetical protein [Hyphomicrobium nitrativorans]|uniref:hypothetical protein n=1 Tax=Hyphomicrobium nitrativorans TaxID=1427356 RepID=UPI001182A540|nr:hypothetical protein [Hyphomicrobium nitrativorans]
MRHDHRGGYHDDRPRHLRDAREAASCGRPYDDGRGEKINDERIERLAAARLVRRFLDIEVSRRGIEEIDGLADRGREEGPHGHIEQKQQRGAADHHKNGCANEPVALEKIRTRRQLSANGGNGPVDQKRHQAGARGDIGCENVERADKAQQQVDRVHCPHVRLSSPGDPTPARLRSALTKERTNFIARRACDGQPTEDFLRSAGANRLERHELGQEPI